MHAVFGEPPSRIAQVTLLTEGTYPHAPGGVSVWCDQLVRALPDVDFRVTALTATGLEQPVWELPPQVRALETVPMWGGTPDGRRPRGRDRRAFLGAWERLLTA